MAKQKAKDSFSILADRHVWILLCQAASKRRQGWKKMTLLFFILYADTSSTQFFKCPSKLHLACHSWQDGYIPNSDHLQRWSVINQHWRKILWWRFIDEHQIPWWHHNFCVAMVSKFYTRHFIWLRLVAVSEAFTRSMRFRDLVQWNAIVSKPCLSTKLFRTEIIQNLSEGGLDITSPRSVPECLTKETFKYHNWHTLASIDAISLHISVTLMWRYFSAKDEYKILGIYLTFPYAAEWPTLFLRWIPSSTV